MAYFLLVGEAPFSGESVVEVCAAHLHQTPTPLSERADAIPPELEALVMRCLAKDPSERPASADELRSALEACKLPAVPRSELEQFWRDYREQDEQAPAEPRTVGVTLVGRSQAVRHSPRR